MSNVIAIAALVVAAGAWFRPMPQPEAPTAKVYSEQEVSDAKMAVCEAFAKASRALQATGGKTSDGSVEAFAVAVNTRLALETTSNFMARTLEESQATPAPLAEATRELSRLYEAIALAQLSDLPQSDINLIASAADNAVARINQSCG